MTNAGENASGASPDGGLTDEDWAALAKFGGSSETSGSAAHAPIPGLEFLGMGYDIFDRYASVESCKQPILDFSVEHLVEQPVIDRSLSLEIAEKAFNQIPMELRLVYGRPEKVTYLPRFEINSVNEFESTIEDQLNKWTAHTNISGNYGLFEGEVDARFSSTLAKLATTKFYSLVSKSTYYELKLSYSIGRPPLVKEDVREDLDNPSVKPADFFDKYGTHYLSSIAIGCKVTVSCAIETSKISSDFDFGLC